MRFNKTVAAFVAITVLAAAAGVAVLTAALRLVLLFLMCGIVAVQSWIRPNSILRAQSAASRCGYFQIPNGSCGSFTP